MTGQQVEDIVFDLVQNSTLASAINGNVYRAGTRPKDSQDEDIVVKFIEGFDGQIETGRVDVNTFIPDIHDTENDSYFKNVDRCRQIEEIADTWIKSLPSELDFYYTLANTINTEQEQALNQHFIAVRLEYKFFNTTY
ncbi:MAG: hypothetical protein LBQ31_09290 [Bacteroidales bacterium]|jgi:hypothetical protein|nr:hypothetical protein [Bacteroidales bacterium]